MVWQYEWIFFIITSCIFTLLWIRLYVGHTLFHTSRIFRVRGGLIRYIHPTYSWSFPLAIHRCDDFLALSLYTSLAVPLSPTTPKSMRLTRYKYPPVPPPLRSPPSLVSTPNPLPILRQSIPISGPHFSSLPFPIPTSHTSLFLTSPRDGDLKLEHQILEHQPRRSSRKVSRLQREG